MKVIMLFIYKIIDSVYGIWEVIRSIILFGLCGILPAAIVYLLQDQIKFSNINRNIAIALSVGFTIILYIFIHIAFKKYLEDMDLKIWKNIQERQRKISNSKDDK